MGWFEVSSLIQQLSRDIVNASGIGEAVSDASA